MVNISLLTTYYTLEESLVHRTIKWPNSTANILIPPHHLIGPRHSFRSDSGLKQNPSFKFCSSSQTTIGPVKYHVSGFRHLCNCPVAIVITCQIRIQRIKFIDWKNLCGIYFSSSPRVILLEASSSLLVTKTQ